MLLYGEETHLVERGAALVRERVLPRECDGSWRTLWADEDADRLPAALGDLSSPSLFGGVDVLVIRHAEALDERSQERVLEVMPRLGPKAFIVLIARSPDMRRRLFAACQREGGAHAFPAIERRAMPDWVRRLARERGHEIAPQAAQELIDRVGNDLGALANELEKLSVHVGPRARIDGDAVRAIVAAARGHGVDELSDRLARRDVAGAAVALRQLLAEGEPPLKILAFVAANLRRALHVAELTETGLTPDEVGRRLGMPGWLVSKNLGRGTATRLAAGLTALRELDRDLKRSRAPEAAFEAAILRIAAPEADARPA